MARHLLPSSGRSERRRARPLDEGPSLALLRPHGSGGDKTQTVLVNRVATSLKLEEENLLLDVWSKEKKVEELCHTRSRETEMVGECGAV